MTDDQIREYALESFKAKFDAKFRAGNKTYRTPIFQKDCAAEAIMEALDLWAYVTVVNLQHARLWELWLALDAKIPVEIGLDGDWNEMRAMLMPKPLAVKSAAVDSVSPAGDLPRVRIWRVDLDELPRPASDPQNPDTVQTASDSSSAKAHTSATEAELSQAADAEFRGYPYSGQLPAGLGPELLQQAVTYPAPARTPGQQG